MPAALETAPYRMLEVSRGENPLFARLPGDKSSGASGRQMGTSARVAGALFCSDSSLHFPYSSLITRGATGTGRLQLDAVLRPGGRAAIHASSRTARLLIAQYIPQCCSSGRCIGKPIRLAPAPIRQHHGSRRLFVRRRPGTPECVAARCALWFLRRPSPSYLGSGVRWVEWSNSQ